MRVDFDALTIKEAETNNTATYIVLNIQSPPTNSALKHTHTLSKGKRHD